MTGVTFTVPGRPVPWARAGHNGARSFTPAKQRAAMNQVAIAAKAVFATPLSGPVKVSATFTYDWPKSARRDQRDTRVWFAAKPDIDNLAKLVLDAMKDIAWLDDAQVVSVTAMKVRAPIAQTVVSISPLDGYVPHHPNT